MPYLGRPVTNAGQFEIIDDISSSFNGSNTSFTLQVGGTNILPDAANVIISLDGVTQIPDSAYSITGSTINFTEAPPSSTTFNGILAGQSQFIESGYITNTHISDSANISGSKINTDFSGKTVTANSGSFNYITASVIDTDASTIRVGGTPINKTLVDNLTTMTGSGTVQGTGQSDSPTFAGGTISGDFTVGGTLTAQEIHTEFTSASILFTSGSTKFGDSSDDVHHMSGSLRITGSGDHYITDGNLGIGTTSPDGKVHIHTASAGSVSAHASADELVVEGSANSGINILSGNSNEGGIYFGDDGDNDIGRIRYDHSNNSLDFFANASEKMMINSSGNVGIGTDNPQKILHTAGDGIRIDRGGGGSYWDIGPDATNDFKFIPNGGTESMRITTSGNVGIGTTSPDGTLHVHTGTAGSVTANSNAANLVVEINGTGGLSILTPDANHGYIIFGSPTSNEGAMLRYKDSDNIFTIGTEDSAGSMVLRTGAGTTALTLAADQDATFAGTVTTTGAVTANGSDYMIKAVNSSTTDGHASRVSAETGTSQGKIEIDFFNDSGRSAGGYGLIQVGKTSNAPQLGILASGGVGIGLNNPDAQLHIKGDAKIVNIESTSATGRCYIMFEDTSSNKGFIGYGSSANDVLSVYNYKNNGLSFGAGNAEVMTIDTSGNVTPDGSLYLAGGSTGRILFNSHRAMEGTTNTTLLSLGEDYTDVRVRANFIPDGDNTRSIGSTSARFNKLHIDSILFHGDTASANELDDYEEGTYTINITGTSADGWTNKSGYGTAQYVKIGTLVTVTARYETQSADAGRTGTMRFNLPFTVADLTDQAGGASGAITVNRTGYALTRQLTAITFDNVAYFNVQIANESGGTETYIDASDIDGTFEGHFSLTYRAA